MSATIDIVIPCAGRVADLLRLLASLRQHCARSMTDHVASITVTDDRPSQALQAALAADYPQVRYLHGPARGPAANRNHGAHQGSAPWLLFLDDDCYVDTDLLDAYRRCAEEHAQSEVLEGAIHPVGKRPNGNHHAPLNLEGGVLWSCNLMIRRTAFEAVSGFDEEFPFACMEDVDLRRRLQACQTRVTFARSAVVHHPWRSIGEREISKQIISHAIYAQKHGPFADQWRLMHLLRALHGRVRLYATGQPSTIPLAKLRAVAYDLVAPVLCFAVIRLAPLRRAIWGRYRNVL